jgi:hypothetical protein
MTAQKSSTHIIFTIVHGSLAVITLVPLGIASIPRAIWVTKRCAHSHLLAPLVYLHLQGYTSFYIGEPWLRMQHNRTTRTMKFSFSNCGA